jgi:uracil-DNA glycosylase
VSGIEAFLTALQQQPDSETVSNPYLQPHCVENLRSYLTLMKRERPKLLLVGEAPGYKGCGITGIPFSSGKLFQQVDHPFLKKLKKSLVLPTIEAENTASIVWRFLAEQQLTPLFWNAYPFHPHPAGNREKNRAPNRQEIEQGVEYLHAIERLFKPLQIAGVGRAGSACAERAFPDCTISYIRHPSYGGKRDFVAGMRRLHESVVVD